MRTAKFLTLPVLLFVSTFAPTSLQVSRAQEPKQEKHFKAESLFPDGSQISRGANILSRPKDGNTTTYIFDAPYEKVWRAIHRAAEELAKFGQCPITNVKDGIIWNADIEKVTKGPAGIARGSWVSYITTEAVPLSSDKTKVRITRKVLERLSDQWVPSNSNGRIERWMLTVIERELITPTPAPDTGPLLSSPPIQETLTNNDIINLVKSGLPDDLIAKQIKNTRCNFNTKTEGLIELKRGGVSSGLIQFIMEHPCP